jgi:hypothetical protein
MDVLLREERRCVTRPSRATAARRVAAVVLRSPELAWRYLDPDRSPGGSPQRGLLYVRARCGLHLVCSERVPWSGVSLDETSAGGVIIL